MPSLLRQLNQGSEDPLKRPVVYVKGADAVKLMNIVNKQKVARARIQHLPPRVSGSLPVVFLVPLPPLSLQPLIPVSRMLV